jgi:signal peptidase
MILLRTPDITRYVSSAKEETGKEEGSGPARRSRARRELFRTLRDISVAVIIVVVLLAGLYAYCGVWPPMVVIESSSMMHGSDSQLGVIDTGDLTLVKKVDGRDGIITYVEAANPKDPNYGFKTYGDFGNVVIYQKSGLAGTPVIHRAVAWLEYNATASDPANGVYKGDLPDIGVYAVTEYTVKGLLAWPRGEVDLPLTIHIQAIFANNARYTKPHDGFITKGDHNPVYAPSGAGADQEALQVSAGRYVESVRMEWVVGRAEGELPWFGLLKLWVSGQPSSTFPSSSSTGLVVTIILLLTVPFALDYFIARRRKLRKARREARREKKKRHDRH